MSAVLPTLRYAASPSTDPREAALARRIAAVLGSRASVASDADLAQLASKGLPAESVKRLAAIGLAARDLEFIIPARTLSHREARGERLTTGESDRALRVARIVAIAETVFSDRDRGLAWLAASKRQLDGLSPLAMMRTEIGARLVEDLLWRIDEGYAA